MAKRKSGKRKQELEDPDGNKKVSIETSQSDEEEEPKEIFEVNGREDLDVNENKMEDTSKSEETTKEEKVSNANANEDSDGNNQVTKNAVLDSSSAHPDGESKETKKSTDNKAEETIDKKPKFKNFKSKSFSSPKKGINDTNPYEIRFVYTGSLLGFYLQRKMFPTSKTYADHLIFKACSNNHNWIAPVGLAQEEYFLFRDGVAVMSGPAVRYKKRFFLFDGEYIFESNSEIVSYVRPIANLIITTINTQLNHDSKMSVPSDDAILVNMELDKVLSDIVGPEAASTKLISVLGSDYNPEEFDSQKETIYNFFAPGNIPQEISSTLGCGASDVRQDSF